MPEEAEEERVGWTPSSRGAGRSQEHPQALGLLLLRRAGPAGTGCFGNQQVWLGTWGGCLVPGTLELSL